MPELPGAHGKISRFFGPTEIICEDIFVNTDARDTLILRRLKNHCFSDLTVFFFFYHDS